jgi:hypothetical protein
MKPKNIKQLQEQSRDLRAHMIGKHIVVVTSISNPVANHIVMVHFDADGTIHARCTCPWALNGGVACTHVMAALELLAHKKGRKLSFWREREEARRQKHRVFRIPDPRNREDGIWITSRSA